MRKYVFKAGLFEPRRKVTVDARDLVSAKEKAKDLLDKRAGDTAPVAWDLELISSQHIYSSKRHWDSSSLRAMEQTAYGEKDGSCSLKVDGVWLDVYWDDALNQYTYKHDRKPVSRDRAVEVHPGGAGK